MFHFETISNSCHYDTHLMTIKYLCILALYVVSVHSNMFNTQSLTSIIHIFASHHIIYHIISNDQGIRHGIRKAEERHISLPLSWKCLDVKNDSRVQRVIQMHLGTQNKHAVDVYKILQSSVNLGVRIHLSTPMSLCAHMVIFSNKERKKQLNKIVNENCISLEGMNLPVKVL